MSDGKRKQRKENSPGRLRAEWVSVWAPGGGGTLKKTGKTRQGSGVSAGSIP